MKCHIKSLKKGSQFKFNDTIYTVKQKFSDWKKDENPYLLTTCGEVFWYDELEVEAVSQPFCNTDNNVQECSHYSKTSTPKIKNEFNRLAEKLGCTARLAGNKKKPKFQMWTGEVSHDGYEIVVGINVDKFSQLINKFPSLQH